MIVTVSTCSTATLAGGPQAESAVFRKSSAPDERARSAAASANTHQLVAFRLDGHRYGLPLASVQRVVRSAEIASLPKAPEIVLGVINVHGTVVPVVNVRKRFALLEREIGLDDQLIIACTSKRTVALVVDAVLGVLEYEDEQLKSAQTVLPGLEYLKGVVKCADGLIFIHDLDTFLSLEEEDELAQALRGDPQV